MALYTLPPFETLLSGDLFGAIYQLWGLALGETIIFQLAFATICGMVWIKTRHLIAAGLAGMFMSLVMVSWPSTVEYLGPEGQFVASLLIIFSLVVVLVRIGISIAHR